MRGESTGNFGAVAMAVQVPTTTNSGCPTRELALVGGRLPDQTWELGYEGRLDNSLAIGGYL